jgi:hypothetical protein
MSQCVVVCYDKELRTPFKATPPMFNRFANGKSFHILGRVEVATLSRIRSAYAPNTRLVKALLFGLVTRQL